MGIKGEKASANCLLAPDDLASLGIHVDPDDLAAAHIFEPVDAAIELHADKFGARDVDAGAYLGERADPALLRRAIGIVLLPQPIEAAPVLRRGRRSDAEGGDQQDQVTHHYKNSTFREGLARPLGSKH